MTKQDLTFYRDQELSDQFMNDENLYHIITNGNWNVIEETAKDCFVFSANQLSELHETFLEQENVN